MSLWVSDTKWQQKKQKTLSNILKDAITICENNLKTKNIDGERTLDYLKDRNLSEQIINNFHIGSLIIF